jgi:CspA family cold shock protein
VHGRRIEHLPHGAALSLHRLKIRGRTRVPDDGGGGVMTSDEIASKQPGGGLTVDRGTFGEIGDETARRFELTGVIKWFDISKRYGFIVPDNGMPDILLHVTCLRRGGFQVAHEGARVAVEVLRCQRGLQAFRVLSMDESSAVQRAPTHAQHNPVAATGELEHAQVKWFNRERGFGFLTTGEGAPDIFVHVETLLRYGLTELRPGQGVLVRLGHGAKGLMAAEVRPEGAPLGPARH